MDEAQILFRNKVDKIKSDTSINNRNKVDRLRFMEADQYTNLRKDSTKTERYNAEVNSRHIYRAIKELDKHTGELLLRANEQ